MPHLSALYVYPVKSCRGISLDEAVLDKRGLLHDRQFLIVDAQDRFLTQRSTPALARILTALTDDALHLQHAATGTIRVPWHLPDAPTRTVTIWRDTVLAYDAGDEAAHWLSDILHQPCRLVSTGERSRREVPAARLPEAHRRNLTTPVLVAFPDAFPLLVLSEESLADLNRRLDEPEPLPVDRFPSQPRAQRLRRTLRRRHLERLPGGRSAVLLRRTVWPVSGDDHGPTNLAARQGTLARPGGLPPHRERTRWFSVRTSSTPAPGIRLRVGDAVSLEAATPVPTLPLTKYRRLGAGPVYPHIPRRGEFTNGIGPP